MMESNASRAQIDDSSNTNQEIDSDEENLEREQ
jgi:hypothetical protein